MVTAEQELVYIVNADDTSKMQSLGNKNAYVITYGLCNKATLTISSITAEHIVLCLQRSILTFSGNVIEPQEFSIPISSECDPETIMLITAMCLVSGIPASNLTRFVF